MKRILPTLLLMLLAIPSPAEEGRSDEARAWDLEMQEAHRRLEEAAAEIARLSQNIGKDALKSMRIIVDKRAVLGINIGSAEDRDRDGVRVLGVSPGGPADLAGLRAGDLLLAIDGQSLAADQERSAERKLLDHLGSVEPGTAVTIEFLRDDERKSTEVSTTALESIPQIIAGHWGHLVSPPGGHDFDISIPPLHFGAMHLWGDMELVSLTPGLGEYFGTDQGLLVVRSPKRNPFGLEDGDVIRRIGGRVPKNPGHAMRILHSYAGGETVELDILRHRRKETLSTVVPERKPRAHRTKSSTASEFDT